MATISSSIISPTTYLHHHSSSKPFKPHLPISSKPNPSFSQSSSLRLQISPILSNPRQPTRLFCVAEETPVAVVTVDPTSEAARRLYVGNIPRTTTNDDLQKVFEEHGDVEKVED
ncbi:putative RNA recognition motif domain, nucleotide-binding alpha-beta plait domain superfamily [Helianthus anomalus]